MSSQTEILFSGQQGETLHIALLRRESPESPDFHQGNWIESIVKVQTDNFSGEVTGYLRSDEIKRFARELSDFVLGMVQSASYGTQEAWFDFDVEHSEDLNDLVVKNTVKLSGILRDYNSNTGRLGFDFGVDIRNLPHTLKQVQHALEMYPVIGHPPVKKLPTSPASPQSHS